MGKSILDLGPCPLCREPGVIATYMENRRYRYECPTCGQYVELNAPSQLAADLVFNVMSNNGNANSTGDKAVATMQDGASNPYWDKIAQIAQKQRNKGIATYGQGLEMNQKDICTRVTYLEEELVDGLMYCEWIKDKFGGNGNEA